MNRKLTLIFISLLLILTTGCGFAPQSAKQLPPQLNKIYLRTAHEYNQFELNFKRRLESYGITLLPSPSKSALILNISSNYNHTIDNAAASSQARIYNLTYTATISISNFYHKEILPSQSARVTRSITLQPNEVFNTTPQIPIIKEEMAQELITKVVNILGASKTFDSLSQNENSI